MLQLNKVNICEKAVADEKMGSFVMDGYFYVLTTIDLFVLCFMCILTHLSESLSEKQKRGFFLAYLMIAGISVLEVITVVVDGLPSGYRWLNIVSNYLGFGLSPAVSVCLVYVLDRKTALRRKIRIAVCCEIAYLMFLLVSVPYGMVFSVSVDNMYSRGPHFYIYVIMYFGAILYLSISTIITAREFQNRSRILIYPLILFVMVETVIQVALPELHVTWLCVTLLSVLYFIYCNEMWNQLDALTGFLNQNSYLNQTQKIKYNSGVLVVFDVDDFKQVNDCHGHVKGDLCLAGIAECIKKAYADSGYCYRIGGDEFCVLLKNRAKEEECRQEFLRRWTEKRRKFTFFPTVSYGSAPFSGEDIAVVKDRADQDMYQYKKGRKKHGSSGVLSEQQKYQN